MNLERLKTLLLMSLVITSIFLTQQLWISLPYNLLPSLGGNKGDEGKSSYIISDIISPEKYIIHFGSNHTILYSDKGYDIWSKVKDVFAKVFAQSDVDITLITKEEIDLNTDKRSIEIFFPDKIPTYIFPKMLSVGQLNSIYKNIETINRVYIPLNGEKFIILSNEDKHLMVNVIGLDIRNIAMEVKKIEDSDYIKYYSLSKALQIESEAYVTTGIEYLSYSYVKNEVDINDYKLVDDITRSFFGEDINYIRKIEETDGSVIFIKSNEEGLKLSSDGTVIYFNSIDREIVERNLYVSLNTAIDFITNHIGWPDNAYLSSIQEIEYETSKGYKFTFSYRIDGRPVILNKDKTEYPIEIEVFNEEVKTYKRYVRSRDKSRTANINSNSILTFEQVLGKNLSIIEYNYIKQLETNNISIENDKLTEKILSSIKDIYLAYYDPCEKKAEEKLINVWVVNIADTVYIFDTITGDILNRGAVYRH